MTEAVNVAAAVEPVVNAAPVVETPAVVAAPSLVNEPVKSEPAPWIANDWREKLSAGDAKELARLQRFTDIGSVYKSYRELEGKVSSGALKQEVDISKFDEAQRSEWYKANGIPEKPEGYQLDLPEGLVLGEEDQVILGSVLEEMHKQGRKPSEVQGAVGAFLHARQVAQASFVENQKLANVQAEETLRQEWPGVGYLTNMAAVKNMLASAPDGIGEKITNARMSDGSIVGSSPEALKWLASMALEMNPAGTIVPGTGANQMESIQAEKNALEAEMKKDINAWRKNEGGRTRHRELIDAELKMKARGY